ncbi:MAG: hypothetical protein IPF98_05625 [Gemmatimonadetes bacterium]|nr:hypothetical protein [Gemmatimonadota bacterium]
MKIANLTRAASLIALVAMSACKSLDVVNPNEPDARRALTDPAALEALAGGTLRSWSNTYQGMEAAGVLTTQAQSYSSSWNNYNMNFYSSLDGDGTRGTRGWQNDPAAAGRTSVEWQWTGYYSTLSSATDVVKSIRIDNVVHRERVGYQARRSDCPAHAGGVALRHRAQLRQGVYRRRDRRPRDAGVFRSQAAA